MTSDDPKTGGGFTMSDTDASTRELPPIDFSTLVLSLATSAMVHLGMAPDPSEEGSDPPEPNLALAQQTIDTLEMLQAKTEGNLDEDETKLLQSVLYELRMSFVKAKD